jgi:hypothetical protein
MVKANRKPVRPSKSDRFNKNCSRFMTMATGWKFENPKRFSIETCDKL